MTRIAVSEHIYLDRISVLDIERLQEVANEPILRQNMGDVFPHPYTIDDATWFINHCHEEREKEYGERNYGIYVDGLYAGNIGYHQKKKGRELYNVHLGYWLGKQYWGKGYMTQIVQVILKDIDANIPDRHRIYAHVVASNPGSRRVLEKNGFLLEGTQRESVFYDDSRYDYRTLSLLKKDFSI